jgi:hypothetical protein
MSRLQPIATLLVFVGLLAASAAGQTLPTLPNLPSLQPTTQPSDGSTGPTNPTDPTIPVDQRFDLTSLGALGNRAPGIWIRRGQSGTPQINEGSTAAANPRMDMFTEFATSMIDTVTTSATQLTQTLVLGLTTGFTGVIKTGVPTAMDAFEQFLASFGIYLPGYTPGEPADTTIPPDQDKPVD